MSRFDTLFNLRYAIRALERLSRFWIRVDALIRFCAILAGSSALVSMVGDARPLAIGLGMTFAILQAIEFSMHPAKWAADAMAARMPYQALLAKQFAMSDGDLEQAYEDASSQDTVIIPESIRRVAYNDVTHEKGCDPAHEYPLNRWQRMIQFVA